MGEGLLFNEQPPAESMKRKCPYFIDLAGGCFFRSDGGGMRFLVEE